MIDDRRAQGTGGTAVTELSEMPMRGWRYGIHPAAMGAQVRSLSRVELPLGEALRLEMAGAGGPDGDQVHLQYFIDTEAGAWALWMTCPREDVAAREAVLQEVTLPFSD